MDVKEVNVKEKKSKKGMVILVSIIILILALLISGYFYLSSPKRIITGYTNSLYNSFEKNSGVNYDSISMNLKVVPTVNNANDKNLETIINKIEFALSGAIDYKNKALKDLKKREFICPECNSLLQRDENASMNLLHLYTKHKIEYIELDECVNF